MKLTDALKKSSVVRRASQPLVVYEVKDDVFTLQGDSSEEPRKLGFEDVNASDWQFQISKWIGTAERKPREAKERK